MSRQLSLWPFGHRVQRLFLLADPLPADAELVRSILRAMHQEYLRAEAGSQTSAVSSAILAGHYLLKHRNREALSQGHVTASAICAASRGSTAFVALAGDVAALAWNGGTLTRYQGPSRVQRPLGLDHQPRIGLWSAPLGEGDRLALVSGASFSEASLEVAGDILRRMPAVVAQAELADVLGGLHGPARVLVAEGAGQPSRAPAIRRRVSRVGWRPPALNLPARRLALPIVGAALVAAVAIGVTTLAEPRDVAQAREAEQLLAQADGTRDAYAARDMAARAQDLARQAASTTPRYAPLLDRSNRTLEVLDRAFIVEPAVLAHLGAAAANVADVAVAPTEVFTLDVAEGSIRRYGLDALNQVPEEAPVVLRAGAPIDGRTLDTPFAMELVPSSDPSRSPALTVIDRRRQVVQLQDGLVAPRPLPTAMQWQDLAALGSDANGSLFVVESPGGRILEYPDADERLADPPTVLLDPSSAPTFPFERIAEILPLSNWLVRLDDGSLRRFDRQGRELAFDVRPPDRSLGPVSALASDGAGGAYIADPTHGRIVHASGEGRFVRQFRDAAGTSLGSLRSLRPTADGRWLIGISGQELLAIELPADVPVPLPSGGVAPQEPAAASATQVVK